MLSRDLTHQLNTAIQFLVECRPLSVSMGNAIKYVKLQACPRDTFRVLCALYTLESNIWHSCCTLMCLIYCQEVRWEERTKHIL